MKCLDPVLCYTNDKIRLFRHFSLASNIIKTVHQQVFDCGKCIFCRKKKSLELATRCVLHSSLYPHNCFITLTYDEKKKGYHNDFQYKDIQNFKKRLRKKVSPEKIHIFNVHEYGKNGKKHWHLIIFNYNFPDRTIYSIKNGLPLSISAELSKLWPYGFSTIGDVSEASAMYQSQYTQKDFKNGNVTNSKKSHSRHSGIGREYFIKNYKQILTLGYIPFSGRKIPIPRYFIRLAHKHYCHFYDQSAFFNTIDRQQLYRPFTKEEPNQEIADLYIKFNALKQDYIKQLELDWNEVITKYLTTKQKPDFIQAAENALYDLKNKNLQEQF